MNVPGIEPTPEIGRPGTTVEVPNITDPGIVSLSPFPALIYPWTWRGRFPHLMPVDVQIWNRFLDLYGSKFLGFQYDVTLGQGAKLPDGFTPADGYLLWALTVKRADCLGIQREGVTLFEVKPRLGMACVGQVLSYVVLWQLQYGHVPAVRGAAVVAQDEPDLNRVMETCNFKVIVV